MLLFRPLRRRDVWDLVVGHVRQAREHIADVLVRIDAAVATARDDRVDHSTPPAHILRADEQPVLLAHRRWANGVLTQVIVDLDSAVPYEHLQQRPLAECIRQCLAQKTLGQVNATLLEAEEGSMKAIEDGAAATLAHRLA